MNEEIAATVEEWAGRWNDDWKHTVNGISERTGLTVRDVMLFMLLVETRMQSQVNLKFYELLLEGPQPEPEARQTFG